MDPTREIIADFCRRYDFLMKEKGYRQLYIMATGGGMGVSSLAVYPGSSFRIASIFHPYSMDELWELVSPIVRQGDRNAKKEDWRSVHTESAEIYLKAMRASRLQDYFFVASTAALETTRRRKGKNVSYVATQASPASPVRVWEILLEKMEERPVYRSHRDAQGNMITITPTADERWNEIFMQDGEINLSMLSTCRAVQDNKISRSILQIILDDKDFYPALTDGERITLLSEGGVAVNQVWLEGKYDR